VQSFYWIEEDVDRFAFADLSPLDFLLQFSFFLVIEETERERKRRSRMLGELIEIWKNTDSSSFGGSFTVASLLLLLGYSFNLFFFAPLPHQSDEFRVAETSVLSGHGLQRNKQALEDGASID